jgi:hypothetical protein
LFLEPFSIGFLLRDAKIDQRAATPETIWQPILTNLNKMTGHI